MSFRIGMHNKRRRAAPLNGIGRTFCACDIGTIWLRQRTGLATAYKLEQHLEPKPARKQVGVTKNRCKWQHYAARFVAPSAVLYERKEMFECSAALNLTVYQTTDGNRRSLTWLQRVHIMRQLLAGMTGFDVVHALAPHTDVPEEVIQRLIQDERWRQ